MWGTIATDSTLPEGATPLTIDPEYFPSRDAVISLPKFIKFWYVRVVTLPRKSVLSLSSFICQAIVAVP